MTQTKDANSKSSDAKNCAHISSLIVLPKVSAETKHENISEIDDKRFKLYQN